MNDIVTSPQVSQLKHNRILEPGVHKRCPCSAGKQSSAFMRRPRSHFAATHSVFMIYPLNSVVTKTTTKI